MPTPDVFGTRHVDHDGELLSFSIQRHVPGRSLAELAGELPVADLETLVMAGGELLARPPVPRARPTPGCAQPP